MLFRSNCDAYKEDQDPKREGDESVYLKNACFVEEHRIATRRRQADQPCRANPHLAQGLTRYTG